MAKTEDLHIRLNAQANITNIGALKKDLDNIMSSATVDKTTVNNLKQITKQLDQLEYSFRNISLKETFNSKDINTVLTKTQALQEIMRTIRNTVKDVDITAMLKNSAEYKKLIQDLQQESATIKQNFKNITGQEFDKAAKDVDVLKKKIHELTQTKQKLETEGIAAEYARLLQTQNNKLDEQKNKLMNLQKLQTEVEEGRNNKAQQYGYKDYASLKAVAEEKNTKANFIAVETAKAEQAETARLTKEYQKFEKELNKIQQYKTDVAKNRNVKRIAEQLGVDADSIEDLQETIKLMKEMISTQAKLNVSKNVEFKQALQGAYNTWVDIKKQAKEYINIIDTAADAQIAVSAATNAKTTSGLQKDIVTTTTTISAIENTEADLQAQAEQANTIALSNINTSLQEAMKLFTALENAITALVGIETKENNYLEANKQRLENPIVSNSSTQRELTLDNPLSVWEKEAAEYNQLTSNQFQAYTPHAEDIMESFFIARSPTQQKFLSALREMTLLFDAWSTRGEGQDEKSEQLLDAMALQQALADVEASFVQMKAENTEELIEATEKIKTEQAFQDAQHRMKDGAFDRLIRAQDKGEASTSFVEFTKHQIDTLNHNLEISNQELKAAQAVADEKTEYQQFFDELYRTLKPIFDTMQYRGDDLTNKIAATNPIMKAALDYMTAKSAYDHIHSDPTHSFGGKTNDIVDQEYEQAKQRYLEIAQETKIAQSDLNVETAEALQLYNETKTRVDELSHSLMQQSQQLKQNSAMARTWEDTLGHIKQTVGAYITFGYILNQAVAKMRQGIEVVKEMDKSITQIGIVSGKTSQQVWKSFNSYNNEAKRLHTTTNQLLQATKLYYQQGLNTAEVNKMIEATAIAAALGEVEMAEAADTLTSIINGYNMAATQAMEVTDKISAVGIDSAADFGELSTAIEKVASSAASAGVDLDHLLGYLGKMIETTREAPTNIGTAMKTIISRMAELKEDPTKILEDGVDANKVQTALRTVGIELFDTTGQMRNLDEVIDELGSQWHTLSRNSQAYIATVVAGNRQQSRFLALMNNYDRTMELVNSATDSSGRSTEQFANYATGLEASLNRVTTAAEKLYASFTSGNSVLKVAYDFLADILEMFNRLGPALTTAGAGLTAFFAKWAGNAHKIIRERSLETIAGNVAANIDADRSSQEFSSFNPTEIFGGTKNNKWAQNIFNLTSKKDLNELNTLIDHYNKGLFQTNNLMDANLPLSDAQRLAIANIAKETGIGADQAANMYIQQQKQNLGTKALTSSMWANAAAQAAISLGITAAILLVTKLVSWLSDMNAKKRETAELARTTAANLSSETASMETYIKKHRALASKVALTAEEKEELQNINSEIMDKYPELIAGIDAEGKAYLKDTNYIKEYIKQKKIEAAMANEEAARATLNSGRYSQGKVSNWSDFILGVNTTIKEEDTYGENSKTALQNVQSAIDAYTAADGVGGGGTANFAGKTMDMIGSTIIDGVQVIGESLKWTAGKVVGGVTKKHQDWGDWEFSKERSFWNAFLQEEQLANIVQEVLNGDAKIDEELYAAIEKKYGNVQGYDEAVAVLQNFEKYLHASMTDMEKQYQQIYDAKREIALLNLHASDEDEALISAVSSSLQQDVLSAKRLEFGTDLAGYEKWLQENQDQLSTNMVTTLNKAFQGNKGAELKIAYQKITDLEKAGASVAEIKQAKQNFIEQVNAAGNLTPAEKQQLTSAMSASITVDEKDHQDSVKQAIEAIGLGKTKNAEKLVSFLNDESAKSKEQIFAALQNFSSLDGYSAIDGTKMAAGLQQLFTNNPEFQKAFNELDFTDQIAVDEFQAKWSAQIIQAMENAGLSKESAKKIAEILVPDPGTVTDQINSRLSTLIGNLNTTEGFSHNQLASGEISWTEAQEAGINTTGMGSYNNGQFIMATDEMANSLKEANKELERQIELLALDATSKAEENLERMVEAEKELENIEKNKNNYATTAQYEAAKKAQNDIIKNAKQQITQSGRQINNAKKLTRELQKQEKLQKVLSDNAPFVDHLSNINGVITSLEDYAAIYQQVENNELSQLDTLRLLCNNLELVEHAYWDANGQLKIRKSGLEELARTEAAVLYQEMENSITKLEAAKAQVDASKTYSEAEITDLINVSTQWGNLATDQNQSLQNQETGLSSNLTALQQWAASTKSFLGPLILLWLEYFKSSEGKAATTNTGAGKINDVTQTTGVKNTQNTTLTGEQAKQKIQEQIDKIKDLQKLIKPYTKDGGKFLDDIAGMGGKGSSGGDAFEKMKESLEKFYNYLRKIEKLEAKINRLRESRNLIDLNKNYYIDDLKEENNLLLEQQEIYRNYIKDQGDYLKELQNQLSGSYSDWVYFDEEGVVQVKQTEFELDTEKEQERYEAFSELLSLYQEEYNTREENITKLTELEKTQLENIKSMYDKILSRVTDITDELNRQIDLLDHDMTMSFSNIAKFDIMDEKVDAAADGLIRTLAYLQDFEKQVNNINDTVKNSQFSELFVWDETLGQWIANEEKLQDESVIKKYEDLGYTWQEIDTWVRDIVTRSQTLKTTIDETTDSSNQFAEALKTLLDDRISAIQDFYSASTEEMNKLFDKLDRKMTNADNANTLFGVASENLEAKYQTAKSAAEMLKATVISLRDNKASILQQIQDEYPEYVDIIEGVAYVNKQAIEESTTLTDGQKAKLLQLYGVMEAAEEQTGEMEDKLFEYYNTMLEMEQAKRDAIIDMQQRVHDEMIARDQEEIDNLSKKYAKMNELDSEYYSKLQQRISDARNARADQQSANNLAQMQARLGVLQRDNGGTYNAELVELQRQINEQLQAQADKSIDDEMERIAREQQERQEDREMQITQMENLLTFKDENGIYWQEALAMINGGPGSVVDYLMGSKEIQNSTMEMQAQSLEEMEDVAATATAELGNIVDGKIKEAMTGIVTGVTTSTEGLKTPLGEIKDAITTATAKYLETMSALFDYLGIEVAEDKAEEQGAETNTDTGSTTAPTPNTNTNDSTTTTPNTNTTTTPTLKVGGNAKAKKNASIYTVAKGGTPYGQYYRDDPKYKILDINKKTKRAKVRYHKLSSGVTGWINLSDLTPYSKGGYVDYTGLAAVHGTQNSPEAFLNAKQTALFEQLRDLLAKPASHMRDDNANGGDNISIESLTIDVKELADTDSIDKVVKTVKQSIYKDATNGNSMKINRRR